MGTGVAVAATGDQALHAGLEVVDDGGNAVDAALTTALVSAATEPGMVSIAGGAFIAIWPADGDPIVVDANVEMPGRGAPAERFGRGLREIRTSYGGGVTLFAGHGSVALPGLVPGFAVAHDRYARLPWERLVRPAAEAARAYPMSPSAARYLSYTADSLFGDDPEAHALVTRPDGGLLEGGEPTSNSLLAATLDRLADQGPELFTSGPVGMALARDMQAHGGLITHEDLLSYRPVVRPAHVSQVGAWRVATSPPPSVGGTMLAIMLGELARCGRPTWADMIEIQRAVLGYRVAVHDLSRDLEADGTSLLRRVAEHGLEALRGSSSTVHVSAIDADGTACAVTMSSGYGAGMSIPGTGVLLNNCLGEVELNRLGLHATAPGTRLASNMAPTTGRGPGRSALAIGSPGADRITTALMQVLGEICLGQVDPRTAIEAPRLHVREVEGRWRVEYERGSDLAAAVAASGLPGHEYPEPHMYFGGVGAAYLDEQGGLGAAGDSRREAAVGTRAE
ncbi:MAG: gamma-glutamyltransferase [Nocardioides sp.]|uniref:gamma-glutamyltransferase n=1 Tax=Nocardioides sp. TaxID=35761 RepID=UPI0039E6B183